MSFEHLPDTLVVHILEYVPNAPRSRSVSKQFNVIISNIEFRVFKNSNEYIKELSPPVYFLRKDDKYHKLILDQAIIEGRLDLIIGPNKSSYKFNVNICMINAA